MKKIMSENNLMIDKINNEIELMERIRIDNFKEIHPYKFRERTYTTRKAISQCFKLNKSMDHFVKIQKHTKIE